jgi:hypothetical protein
MSTAPSPNPPSRHHYIPEFLLKRWADENGQVMGFTAPVPGKIHRKRVFPSQIGFARDLYRSPRTDPVAAQALETGFFSALDNLAAKALDTLLIAERRTLHRESLEIWCVFIFALLHRNPAYFEALIEGGKRQFGVVLTDLAQRYEAVRNSNDPTCFEGFVSGLGEDYAKTRTFDIIPSLILNSNIIAFLHQMHWAVLCTGGMRPNLLLSDDPLVRTNGLRIDGGHVALPISPDHLMIGAWQREKLLELQRMPPAHLIQQVNQQTVGAARYFVVSTDERQARFIENRFGKTPRSPLISGDR